jgi:GNAT superfamily N-acetyltransferase
MSEGTGPSAPQDAPAEPYEIQIEARYRILNAEAEVIAQCRIYPLHGVLWLSDVWVHASHRGRGLARKVIGAALRYYGAGNPIWLNIQPYSNRPKGVDQLAAFYMRFGFVRRGGPGMMVRKAAPFDEAAHGG